MIGMAWENTLLASRILPPAYTPIEVATNRSQDASLMLEQDGRLTLLIILTTSAGLAIVLLFFIFLRIGCLRGQSCLGRYKDRHDRSACPLTTVVLDDHASITKSLAASQQTIQTSLTQTHPPGDTYAIKLVDNDLIVETQDWSGCGELATTSVETSATLKMPNPPREAFSPSEHRHDNDLKQTRKSSSPPSAADDDNDDAQPSGFLVFKTWLSGMKSKELATGGGETGAAADDDAHLQQQPTMTTTTTTPLETKSLCGSPKRRYGRSPANVELIATHKQQIMARFGQHHLPGFGFTQSKSSCLFEDDDDDDGLMVGEVSSFTVPPSSYSYRNGNQFEYMGGPYGYVDPIYSHQLASSNNNRHPAAGGGREAITSKSFRHNSGRINNNSVRLEELDIVQHDQRSTSLFGQQPMSVARQPESATSSHPQPVLLLLPTLVRSAESLVVLSK